MDDTERLQLMDRLKTITIEMDQIVREIGPKWIRLAHLRNESREIIKELELDIRD